jgi:hypothetical protein
MKVLKGVPYVQPSCRNEYLAVCKDVLEPEDYKDILCAILDEDFYQKLEEPLQKIVRTYYDNFTW